MARRRRITGAALALGTSGMALGAVGGARPATAGTAVTTTATCAYEDRNGQPQQVTRLRTTGLVPNRDFATWIYADPANGDTFSFDGFYFRSDSSGAINVYPFSYAPSTYYAWTVYDDVNVNGSWNPDVDRTYAHVEGTITACPQTITMTPK